MTIDQIHVLCMDKDIFKGTKTISADEAKARGLLG